MKDKRGFTLIELLVVIAIVGIIIMMSCNNHVGVVNKSNIATAENELRLTAEEIKEYLSDYGEIYIEDYDSMSEEEKYNEIKPIIIGINAYIDFELDTENFIIQGNELIISEAIRKTDPWGSNYKVVIDLEGNKILITSIGPDKEDNYSGYEIDEFSDDIVQVIEFN